MYLTYEEYQILGGAIDEATFTRLEFMASKLIDRFTFERLHAMTTKPKEVQMCMFEMINLYGKHNTASAEKDVSQMSNNGVSVQYINASYIELDDQMHKLVKLYLSNVKTDDGNSILYAGVKQNETTFCR